MSFYGRSSRFLIEQELQTFELKASEIVCCDLRNLKIESLLWEHTDIRDLNANDIEFRDTQLKKSVFFRSNFISGRFYNSVLTDMLLDGLTLIKSIWQKCVLIYTNLRNSCLQRAQFTETKIISSSFLDFEALNVKINNCIFVHCRFQINYGSGMNGFSGSEIQNCIFYNCRFDGFPLRGASLKSTVFLHCNGEIGDEIDCINVVGFGIQGRTKSMQLRSEAIAARLLDQFGA